MPSPLEPLAQLVFGALEAITPFALGKSAQVELLTALTPIAGRLQEALAQVPFEGKGQQLLALEAEVKRLEEVALRVHSKLSAAQRQHLENVQDLLTTFLHNASSASYSEGFAVLTHVRQLQDDLR
jgi:hypothetical protein